MSESLYKTITMLKIIRGAAKIKINTDMSDFLTTRLVQVCTESNLLAAIEKLTKIMDITLDKINTNIIKDIIKIATSSEANLILGWLRQFPKFAIMLSFLNDEELKEACKDIIIENINTNRGTALPQGTYDIKIKLTTVSPLSHGSDLKAGNATLFRGMQVLSTDNTVLTLPFYAGNAFRGEMRDCLADHFLKSLGIKTERNTNNISLAFFHILYAGGVLEENSGITKVIANLLGNNGAIKAKGIYTFRKMLPHISLLGTALGNRILAGRCKFADFRPECIEWNNGVVPAAELMDWLYITRREDNEDSTKNMSMIANTEVIKSGVNLHGGIDMDNYITDIEKSALALGITLINDKGYIGAESRRGFGNIKMLVENLPSTELYTQYLADNKESILDFLKELQVFDTTEVVEEKPIKEKKAKEAKVTFETTGSDLTFE